MGQKTCIQREEFESILFSTGKTSSVPTTYPKGKEKKKSSATQKEKKKKKKIKCMDRKALTSTYLLEECINMARIFLDYSLNLFP